MSSKWFPVPMIAAVLAAGCAIQPRLQSSSVPAPPRFAAAETAAFGSEAPVASFWTELGDSTLEALVVEALRSNLDVRAAEARVLAAEADRSLAAYDYFPTVTASGSYLRQRFRGPALSGLSNPIEQDLYETGVDATWEVDLFGRIRGTVAGRNALAGAAFEDVRDAQVLLASEVGRTYFDLRGAQEQLAVAERNAENQRRTLRVTEDRLAGGRGTAFDTERAKAQFSATLARIPELEARVAGSKFRIGFLLGRSPEIFLDALEEARAFPELPVNPDVGTPDLLVRQRPDVRGAERRLAAETAFVGAARAEFFPRVSVSGSAGYTSMALDALGESDATRYVVGPTVSWPLFDLGRVGARVSAAQARAAEARATYDRSVLVALEEAEFAIVSYDRSRARLGHLGDAAAASDRAAELARLRFEEGLTGFLEVLDAERTMLDAQDRLAQGRTDAVNALVELYRALGGAWPVTEEPGER